MVIWRQSKILLDKKEVIIVIFKEMLKAIWFQIKRKGAFKDIFITHNAFGIFSRNSHENFHYNVGKVKQMYDTREKAEKSANFMANKYGDDFSAYKCAYCTGWHIGKNLK